MIIGIIGHTFNLIHSSWGYPIFQPIPSVQLFRGGRRKPRGGSWHLNRFLSSSPCVNNFSWEFHVEGFIGLELVCTFQCHHCSQHGHGKNRHCIPRSHFMAVSFHYTSGFFSPGGPGVVSFHFHMPWGPWKRVAIVVFLAAQTASFRPAVDNEASNSNSSIRNTAFDPFFLVKYINTYHINININIYIYIIYISYIYRYIHRTNFLTVIFLEKNTFSESFLFGFLTRFSAGAASTRCSECFGGFGLWRWAAWDLQKNVSTFVPIFGRWVSVSRCFFFCVLFLLPIIKLCLGSAPSFASSSLSMTAWGSHLPLLKVEVGVQLTLG